MQATHCFDYTMDADNYLDLETNAAAIAGRYYDYNNKSEVGKGFKDEFGHTVGFIYYPIPYVKMKHNPLNMYDYCNEKVKQPYDRIFIFEDNSTVKVEDKFRSNGVRLCHKFILEEFACKDCDIFLIDNKDAIPREERWYLKSLGKQIMSFDELYTYIYLKGIEIHNKLVLAKHQSHTYRIGIISIMSSNFNTAYCKSISRIISYKIASTMCARWLFLLNSEIFKKNCLDSKFKGMDNTVTTCSFNTALPIQRYLIRAVNTASSKSSKENSSKKYLADNTVAQAQSTVPQSSAVLTIDEFNLLSRARQFQLVLSSLKSEYNSSYVDGIRNLESPLREIVLAETRAVLLMSAMLKAKIAKLDSIAKNEYVC